LTGTVADSSGGVLAKVEITLTHEATHIATVSQTNETGRYFVTNLKPGVYTVAASLAGFRSK